MIAFILGALAGSIATVTVLTLWLVLMLAKAGDDL